MGFDNISIIEKCGLHIDTLEYSCTEIANAAVETILKNKRENVIVSHVIKRYTK